MDYRSDEQIQSDCEVRLYYEMLREHPTYKFATWIKFKHYRLYGYINNRVRKRALKNE